MSTKPFRDEIKRLLGHIEHLCQTASLIGEAPVIRVLGQLEEDDRFLTRQLLPHTIAESSVLYPAVERLVGTADYTAALCLDQAEIGSYVDELRGLRDELRGLGDYTHLMTKELRRVLYGLYALIRLHFAKEIELYLPLLEQRMSAEEIDQLFTTMQSAAHEAKGKLLAH